MDTHDVEAIKQLIRQAFADVPYPGDDQIVARASGYDEEHRTQEAFSGLTDWRTIDITYLDAAPHGYGSALSFFAPPALRFYLPAYLLADLDGKLVQSHPAMTLTFRLTAADQASPTSRAARQKARWSGGQTTFDIRSQRFVDFTREQAAAVVVYLEYKLQRGDWAYRHVMGQQVTEALELYWYKRLKPPSDEGVA